MAASTAAASDSPPTRPYPLELPSGHCFPDLSPLPLGSAASSPRDATSRRHLAPPRPQLTPSSYAMASSLPHAAKSNPNHLSSEPGRIRPVSDPNPNPNPKPSPLPHTSPLTSPLFLTQTRSKSDPFDPFRPRPDPLDLT